MKNRSAVAFRRSYDLDSLTDVALRVFAERGYDGSSVDDVARAAGITKASIYHHVPSKEALLERGLQRALDALFAILEEPEAREGRALARFRFILRRGVELTIRLLPELSVLFRCRGNTEIQRAAIGRRRQFKDLMVELPTQAQREGDVRADLDATLIVQLVFGMTNSIVEWFRVDGRLGGDVLTETAVKLAIGGVTSDSAHSGGRAPEPLLGL